MKKSLSILIYSLASGGAERVVSILLNELKNDFDTTLILMNDTIFYELPKDIEIIYLEKSNPHESGIKKLLKLPFLGFKYRSLNKSDISLSFMNRPNYINIFAKIFGMKGKVFISERIAPSQEYKTNGVKDIISRFLIKKMYNKSDKIIPNSKGIGYDLIDSFHVIEDKIKIINNPVNLSKIKKMSQEESNLQNDIFTFITIGRMHHQKNHKLLINAIKNINAKLYIIGDGELKKDLQNQIKDLKLEKKVILLGRQKKPYMYLVKSDCFVFSSSYEGFPNVLLEALACELPIISTDCKSGPREILAPDTDYRKMIDNGIEKVKYGILTAVNNQKNMEEAMKLMMEDKALRNSYKQKALKRANDFSMEKIIQQYKEILCADL